MKCMIIVNATLKHLINCSKTAILAYLVAKCNSGGKSYLSDNSASELNNTGFILNCNKCINLMVYYLESWKFGPKI